MSRLDSMIKRLIAQRLCLDMCCERVAGLDGVVFEIGLGNGRTYDHLRQKLPGREIFVFDRALSSHPDCRPDAEHAVLGDIMETLPAEARRHRGRVMLAHSDIGNGVPAYGRKMAGAISAALAEALMPGGHILSDEELDVPGTEPVEPPDLVDLRRYFLYRRV